MFDDGATGTPAAEQFRVLAQRLRRARQSRSLARLLVTSCFAREGKTFASVNLAAALALTSHSVLLIDADFHSPGVHSLLGLPLEPGLADLLENRSSKQKAIRYLDRLGFHCVTTGIPSYPPAELLHNDRFRGALSEFQRAFEWIVFDSPPCSLFADAHALAEMADGVLLVVRAGVARPDEIESALHNLNGTHVAGIVLNACDRRTGRHHHLRNPAEPVSAGSKACRAAGGRQ